MDPKSVRSKTGLLSPNAAEVVASSSRAATQKSSPAQTFRSPSDNSVLQREFDSFYASGVESEVVALSVPNPFENPNNPINLTQPAIGDSATITAQRRLAAVLGHLQPSKHNAGGWAGQSKEQSEPDVGMSKADGKKKAESQPSETVTPKPVSPSQNPQEVFWSPESVIDQLTRGYYLADDETLEDLAREMLAELARRPNYNDARLPEAMFCAYLALGLKNKATAVYEVLCDRSEPLPPSVFLAAARHNWRDEITIPSGLPQSITQRAAFGAAVSGCLETLEKLVQHGAKLDAVVNLKSLATGAAEHGQVSVLQFLASRGINIVQQPSEKDESPIWGASHSIYGESPLVMAAERGRLTAAQYLMDEGASPAQVNSGFRACSPFEAALANGHAAVLREFIRRCPELVESKRADGKLHAHILLEDESVSARKVVETLHFLVHEAHTDINALDSAGCSPLHMAARAGRLDVIRELVGLGADVFRLDGSGQSSVEIALSHGKIEAAGWLADRCSEPKAGVRKR